MDFYIIFLDCDCQTLNVVVYNDVLTYQSKYEGIYQRIVDVNGRTAWNSSNTKGIWWAPSSDDWNFGPMENLGETYGGIRTTGAGNLSCLYNLQGPGDQWVYYNSAWMLAIVGDVSIQCLSGIPIKSFLRLMSGSFHIQSVLIGVKYRNCCLDDYLLFAIWTGQIQSKLIYTLVTDGLAIL